MSRFKRFGEIEDAVAAVLYRDSLDALDVVEAALAKAKREYDATALEAAPDECWAEIEAGWDALGVLRESFSRGFRR